MTDTKKEETARWRNYYELSLTWPPRQLVYKTAKRFETPGFAIDLGCGVGMATEYLLKQGWRVLAIDAQAVAIEMLRERITGPEQQRLETQVATFETMELPPADLIWAGNSLPFCPQDYFPTLWDKVVTAVKPNGRFAGDLFGDRHAWNGRPPLNFHSKEAILALVSDLKLEFMVEQEGSELTGSEGYQHWHSYGICVLKVG